MKKYFALMLIILTVFALLVWQRFDMPPQVKATVIASTSDAYQIGDRLKRGQVVETGEGAFVAFEIGEARVGLAEKTSLELHRLFEDERVLQFSRGRMVLNNGNSDPVFIDTLKTQNTVTRGKATFINFDFLQTVHIIPLEQTVQTTLTGSKTFMLLPVPIAVHESGIPSFEPILFNVNENAAVDFYRWFDAIPY